MRTVRESVSVKIQCLLRLHDKLPYEALNERHALERQILFLMDGVKAHEFEQSFREAA